MNAPGRPLLEAAYARDVSKLRVLLRERTAVADHSEAILALGEAACDNHAEVVEILVEEGVDVNGIDPSGLTPLTRAAYGGSVPMVKRLLAAGAAVNLPDSRGMTPLHYAAVRQSLDLTQLLIGVGADPELRDNSGNSPLDLARQRHVYLSSRMPLIGDTHLFGRRRKDTPTAAYLRALSRTA